MVGVFRHKLDAKNRLVLPAPWRSEGALDHVFVSGGGDGDFLQVVTPDGFRAMHAEVQANERIDPETRRELSRFFYGSFKRCGVDRSHRVLLPGELVEGHDLSGEVVLNGLYDKFEIWQPERHAERAGASAVRSQACADLARKMGLL